MRLKRWAPPPLSQPPGRPPPHAVPAPPRRSAPPPHLAYSPAPAPPPHASTSAELLPDPSDSVWPTVQRIRDLLRTVPSAGERLTSPQLPLRLRRPADLERELVQRRKACTQIFRLLQGRMDAAAAAGKARSTLPAAARDRKGKGKARENDHNEEEREGPIASSAAARSRLQLPPWIEREVVHLVAHTMRLQLFLGDVSSAKELDRAFFSHADHPACKRARRLLRRSGRGYDCGRATGTTASRAGTRLLGTGLGLPRGAVESAWMQSLAVRLRAGEDSTRSLERFLRLYKASQGWGDESRGSNEADGTGPAAAAQRLPGGGGSSHVLAFLARNLDLLQTRVRLMGPGLRSGRADRVARIHRQLRTVMDGLRAAEQEQGELVALALLESSIARLEATEEEEGASRAQADDPLYRQVKAEVERLVASLGDVLEGLEIIPGRELTSWSRARSYEPSWTELEHRAQVLHLAIRFLLVCARTRTPDASAGPGSPLASASQLYLLLLDLLRSAAAHPVLATLALPRLRLRQSSALFRLVSAHLSALSAAQHHHDHHHSRRRTAAPASSSASSSITLTPYPRPAWPDPLAPLTHLLSLLTATLSTLSLSPPAHVPGPSAPTTITIVDHDRKRFPSPQLEPIRLGLSTHVVRHVLLVLGGAFEEARPARKAARPTFAQVRETCEVLLRCREHDAVVAAAEAAEAIDRIGGKGNHDDAMPPAAWSEQPDSRRPDQPLLRREDCALALVRAALLSEASESRRVGGPGTAEEDGEEASRGETLPERLEWLLDWVARLQRASPRVEPTAMTTSREREDPAGAKGPLVGAVVRGGTRERKARKTVARAVRRILERAWGPGEGGAEWREGVMMSRVEEWLAAGEEEWGSE